MDSKHKLIAWVYTASLLVGAYFADDYFAREAKLKTYEMELNASVDIEKEKTKRYEIMRDLADPQQIPNALLIKGFL